MANISQAASPNPQVEPAPIASTSAPGVTTRQRREQQVTSGPGPSNIFTPSCPPTLTMT
jgi:hypothetical protein